MHQIHPVNRLKAFLLETELIVDLGHFYSTGQILTANLVVIPSLLGSVKRLEDL